MPNRIPIAIAQTRNIHTQPAPITPDWIIAGTPTARSALLSQSPDKQAVTMYWECTAGVFRWHFESDETVYIVEGAVTVSWNGERTTLAAGDTCFFPADTVATWNVHNVVRKIAFIRVPPPTVISLAIRAYRRFIRMASPSRAHSGAGALNPAAE